MPRAYSKENLDMAVNAVMEGGLSVHSAVKEYGVPYGTLWRRVNGAVDTDSFSREPPPSLGRGVELELKDAIVEMQKIGYGLTRKEIMEMAANVDAKSDMPTFKSGVPSNRWYQRFMARHNLSLRTPENLSVARLQMSTISVRDEFFDCLTKKIHELNVAAAQIFNVDESGLQVVSKGRKIAAPKGCKTVYKTKSGERSENITVVACANASGTVVLPPMVIFKGESLNQDLISDAPEGTIFSCSKKGYMVSELFFEWFVKFLTLIPPKRPVLLLLDGHATHMSKEVVIMARENGIHFLCFPPHTTHLYQPMDVGLFKALKDKFKDECDKRMRRTKKNRLNRYDFFKVFTPSWIMAAAQSNVIGGFVGSGIWPINRDRIRPERLIGSLLPEPLNSTEVNGVRSDASRDASTSSHTNSNSNSPIPSTSGSAMPGPTTKSPVVAALYDLFSPVDTGNNPRKSRAITKTRCLTSDEFLSELEEKEKAKERNLEKKAKKRKIVSDEEVVELESEQEEEEDIPVADDDLATPCGECGRTFDTDCHGENWFSCCGCRTWFHLTCQGFSNNSKRKQILCEACKEDM